MARDVGKLRIILEAITGPFKKDLKSAEDQVESFAKKSEEAGNRSKDGFSRAGEGIEKATGGVRKLAGAIGSTIGIATALAGAVVAVVNAVKELIKRYEDGEKVANRFFASQIDSVNDTEGALRKVNERIKEVSAELESADRGGVDSIPFVGRSRRQIEQELEALRDRQLSISRQVRRQRELDAKEAARAEEEAQRQREQNFLQLQDRLRDQLKLDFAPDEITRIQRQAEIQKEELIRAAKEAGVAVENTLVQANLRTIEVLAEKQIEAARKAIAEEERLRKESADRVAKATAQALEREFRGLAQSLNGIFGQDFTTRLDTIVDRLDEVNGNIAKGR